MSNRRKFFLRSIAAAAGGLFHHAFSASAQIQGTATREEKAWPVSIATWNHGLAANKAAEVVLQQGGRAIDAVEQGVRVVESDPKVNSVGYGGLPDRDGRVTLDACIMDEKGNAGSVCFLQYIKNPISVARKVMEDTPHVMLSGDGALQFAISKGFKREALLTDEARRAWREWLRTAKYRPIANIENHDTVSMLAIDRKGDMAGACSTSGLAFKMHGRVGDSPIIGAGLYVDNEVGGACATGLGELVMKTLGAFLIVELMRQGATPQQACEEATARIVKRYNVNELQVGYLALNKNGEAGIYSIRAGFNYALYQNGQHKLRDAPHWVK